MKLPAVIALTLCTLSLSHAQEKPPPPVSKPLQEARKKAVAELSKMKDAMTKKGMKAEVGDCDSIMAKLCAPDKSMPQKGAFAPFPGEKEYDEMISAWVELGTALGGIYKDCLAELKDKAEQEQVELFVGWFATWDEIAKGIRHLNARRKMCKLAPVTEDWSGSWGGYLHARYLKLNAKDPSVAGLGAHNEDPKLPGHTIEGEEAGHAILGGGTSESVMDSWLGSRYHRDPVFSSTCGRVCFGGLPGGWWACPSGGGMAGKPLADIITWPGDGDTAIPTAFGGEAPDPFPKGMTSSGTIVIVQFLRAQPKKPTWHLYDPDKKEITIVNLMDSVNSFPICFVAKDPLKGQTKYSVEVVGQDGSKFSFSFTTQ